MALPDFDALPGGDFIQRGLAELAAGVESDASLLVCIGAPRLRDLGLDVGETWPNPEHRLYDWLSREDADSAHARYNALVRRLVSFEQGLRVRALRDAHGEAGVTTESIPRPCWARPNHEGKVTSGESRGNV